MGEYPYDCAICGGAYERCANTDADNYDSDGEEEGCECGGEGGQFCWENSVVCRVERVVIEEPATGTTTTDATAEELEELEALKKLKVGDILTGGTYTGGGIVFVDGFGEFKIIVDKDCAECMKNYAFCTVWCASCYYKAKRKGKL